MHSDQTHPLQRYWNLAAAPVQAAALDAALEFGVFDRLHEPASAAEVADALGLRPAQTASLLDMLWSLDLLQRIDGMPARYVCQPQARLHFCQGQPGYCADAWRYRRRALAHFGDQMRALLSAEGPAPDPYVQTNAQGWADAARVQIGQEQRAIAVAAAREAVRCVPGAAQARRILDLGGGPGLIGIDLVRSNPAARGVVFDWPETAAVAQENIAQAGLSDRMSVLGGDLARDPIGQGYDLIWCSSVLHFVPDAAAALRKMRDALAPGGLLLMAHAEIPADAAAAARVLAFYMPMQLLGRRVTRQGELRRMLLDAGYADVRGFDSAAFPMAPLHVLTARKDELAARQ
ncbi:methyltransferase [Achromobacter arsenitoxydans]|uniref:Type 12 methyltransferase n=1 Tax=Achromobacter arsenitoxydans SY8 TaxID=477184 RepID=H0FBT9_9BURK|nr:methyltransferase [Achromobacter arsenitoxydans]EHK64215.1 type 12 methyltransferase [Achromobacter arsenitoxydans SY8]